MVTLSVKINGGTAPIPVHGFVKKLNGDYVDQFEEKLSFDKNYDLPPGKYIVSVGGMNPEGGFTIVDIEGEFTEDPQPQKLFRRATPVYSVFAVFSV
ncbi:MAG: hypothetical protein ACHQD9_01175 [Chitinophagales bacterium]